MGGGNPSHHVGKSHVDVYGYPDWGDKRDHCNWRGWVLMALPGTTAAAAPVPPPPAAVRLAAARSASRSAKDAAAKEEAAAAAEAMAAVAAAEPAPPAVAAAAAANGGWTHTAKSTPGGGPIVRATASLSSAFVARLQYGTRVEVVETRGNRARLVRPVAGWASLTMTSSMTVDRGASSAYLGNEWEGETTVLLQPIAPPPPPPSTPARLEREARWEQERREAEAHQARMRADAINDARAASSGRPRYLG